MYMTAKPRKHHSKGVLILYGIIVFSLLSAWLLPLGMRTIERLRPTATVSPRTEFAFTALAYSDADGGLTREVFTRHLEALTANGFNPVTLEDVRQLVMEGRALPAKAVLLTVDDELRSTVSRLRPALRRHGWNAVLCVASGPVEDGRGGALNWNRMRRMARSDRWEIASRGHSGNAMAELADAADEATEVLAALRTRVAEDVTRSMRAFAHNLGHAPTAFAFPEGQFGQLAAHPEQATSAAMDAVTPAFRLAFTAGETGLNTVFSDPYRINRLQVDPGWSSRELLDRLDRDFGAPDRIEDLDRRLRRSGWVLDRGRIARATDGLRLATGPHGGVAQAWLAGSNLRTDFTATLYLTAREGDVHILLRANPRTGTLVECRLAEDGRATIIQRTHAGRPPAMLADASTPYRPGQEHRIDIAIQGPWLDVRIDGMPAFPDRVRMQGEPASGFLGVRVAADDALPALATVRSARLEGRRPTVASWAMGGAYTPYVIDWLHRNAGTLTGISPHWDLLDPDAGTMDATTGFHPVFSRLARLYNLRLIPKVSIPDAEAMADWQPRTLAERAAAVQCDGIYADFSEFGALRAEQLEQWLRDTSRMLSGTGRPILVRIPPLMERLASINSLLAMIPAVEIVTAPGVILPAIGTTVTPVSEQRVPEPTRDQLRALPSSFTIGRTPADQPPDEREIAIRQIRDEGETAFLNGAYERAIASFSEWHRLAPETPEPLNRIGDALVNLGFHDEAIDFYRRSLDRDPGQTDLAVRQARLLTSVQRMEEARELLNAYARLFPNDTRIMFAQAEWLFRQNRLVEARERISRILELEPDDFDATLFMIRLTDVPSERADAIDKLMAMGDDPQQHQRVVNAIWEYDLLTLPESHILVQLIERIDTTTTDPRIRNLVDRLRPRTEMVSEVFDADGISDAWLLDGATSSIEDGIATVTAMPTREEFLVRLLRSERWRDAFFEVDLDSVTGSFWIYARRSRDHLVRFGVDPRANRMHVQVWKGKHNDVVLADFVPWERDTIRGRFRLEVRGNGIVAFLDGRQVFDSVLPLPEDVGLGWSALAVHSPVRGRAQVTMRGLRAGPLPVRLATLPAGPSDTRGADAELERLRTMLPYLTDFSPAWFQVDANGNWSSRPVSEDDFYRLFARYHRIRFVPTVQVAAGAELSGDDILTVVRTHRLHGLVLRFEAMPDEAWFNRMDVELREPEIDLIALAPADVAGALTMRNVAASRREIADETTSRNVRVIAGGDTDRLAGLAEDEPAVIDFAR